MSEINLYCITTGKTKPAPPRAWMWTWKGRLFFECVGSNGDIWEREPFDGLGKKYHCWQSSCRVEHGRLVGLFSDPVLFDETQEALL